MIARLAFAVLAVCAALLPHPCVAAQNPIVEGIRYPVAAGVLYPERPAELRKAAQELLISAERRIRPEGDVPKALIVPSGSLFLSGDVSAAGYVLLKRAKPFIRRVVILYSPANKKDFGAIVPAAKYWEMPDRRFEIDVQAADALAKIPGIVKDDAPHSSEYAAEVQLPFVSALFGSNVKILPVLVADASILQVSDLIDAVWGGPETVVIVVSGIPESSSRAEALKKLDDLRSLIEKKKYDALKPCNLKGILPVQGLLHYLFEHDFDVSFLKSGTSSDIFPLSSPVAGYVSFGVWETVRSARERREKLENLLRENQVSLLRIAAHSILTGFERRRPPHVRHERYPEALRDKGAVFVSLYYNGALRGSVGSTEPLRSVLDDVSENAYAAAFQDFRFAPLEQDQIKDAEISISLLTPKVPLKFSGEAELLKMLRPNIDGLVLRERENKALFLPSVWDTFSSPKEFLIQLKRKAGLSPDYWSETLKVYRFEVIDVNSGDLPDPKSIWY